MQIFIKNLSGKTVTYEVDSTDTVLSLKRHVREREGIPLRKIVLRYSGGMLDEHNGELRDYNILPESTLYVHYRMGGASYCSGCILPALTCLSAHVSLQCGEKLSFDREQLLHSIKTKLISLNNDAIEVIIDCIETCGKQWNDIENDDADYFQNHTQQRRLEAIDTFIGAICGMINPYLQRYRTSNMLESTQDAVSYTNAYNSEPIDMDWLTFLHETRCPVCFCRFNHVQPSTNILNRTPMALCSVSEKHIVCYDCCQKLRLCPLCNGKLATNIAPAQSMVNVILEAQARLEEYCFPSDLAKEIIIKSNQQPIAHGAMGQLFCVNNKYAVKCALTANTLETEEALIHEIAVSRPLAHIPYLVAVYGGVRLPKHGIGIVMEYINGLSLAAALADSSTIIQNLSIRERLKIALGIAQGLGELHLAKLVHRDFKPENVLLSKSTDGSYTPKIADFGVSFQLAIGSATTVKESCGTVGYDAPEVAIDSKTPSIASDVYALAFTLYELLTAKRIFTGLKSAQILAKFTMNGERPHNWPDGIPNYLRETIEKAWSVKPDERATIGELIDAIRRSLDPNQLSCIEMIRETNKRRKKITTVQFENFEPFELFALNEFVKRMMIDDCEAIQMFIDELSPSL